ncbi:aminotransferase class III-fold pyridoxal phosphate-dependent enzyme [Gammaproteobacteria bacterium]|nr:aminotransferase class III-fold pyridoxal phosphate-dependent enzyme [Gammaproteobacteria bacterium]
MKNTTYEVKNSDEYLSKARKVIPGGIFGHYKYAVRDSGPKFFSKSEGAYFWDLDDNRYVDLMCGYGPSILGYNNPEVEEAFQLSSDKGNTVSIASPVMVDLASKLVDMIDIADWTLFGKNGGDATSLAVMIAREFTKKEKIIKIDDGYHGVAPWMQDESRPGIIPSDNQHILKVKWNDIDQLENLLQEQGDKIACFISSPYDHPVSRDNSLPEDGYWKKVRSLCKKYDVLTIVDDVRAGFRINLKGSNVTFGFSPDMICFGKAIANGHPLAALVGTNELKEAAERVYFTGTQFFSAPPMAAAIATLNELEKVDAPSKLKQYGEDLNNRLVKVAQKKGFNLIASGIPSMPYYRLEGVSFETHFKWIDECVKRGVYMLGYHNHFISLAHSLEDIDFIENAASQAFDSL